MNFGVMEIEVTGKGSWKFRLIEKGLIELERTHAYASPRATVDAMGPYWFFGIAEVTSGVVTYETLSVGPVNTKGNYGFFLPARCLVFSTVDCQKQTLRGIISQESLPETFPKTAFIFKPIAGGKFPSSITEIGIYLDRCQRVASIEYNSHPSALARKIRKAIDRSFKGDLSLTQLAKELKTSSTLLGRVFRKDFRLTPVKYRNHMRVVAGAFGMLAGKKVTDVYEEVGFNDLSRFNKQFRQMTGTTPRKFSSRKKSRKTPSI